VVALLAFVAPVAAFFVLEPTVSTSYTMWSVVAALEHGTSPRARLPTHRVHREALLLRGENRTFSVLGFERWVESRTVLIFVRNGTQ